jgi:hypothetical protein
MKPKIVKSWAAFYEVTKTLSEAELAKITILPLSEEKSKSRG